MKKKVFLLYIFSSSMLFSYTYNENIDYVFGLIENNSVLQNTNDMAFLKKNMDILNREGLFLPFVNTMKDLNQNILKDSFFELFEFSNCENPSITTVIVSSNKLYFNRLSFRYGSDKIDHKIIAKTLHSTDKVSVINLIKKLDLKELSVTQNQARNNILIFKIKDNAKEYKTYVIEPLKGFVDVKENSLLALRNYILSIIGLNQVCADFSTMSDCSLHEKLRSNALTPYKNIDEVMKIFLKANKNNVTQFYQRVFGYYSASTLSIDKYLAIWIFLINEKIDDTNNVDFSFLFENKYKDFILDIKRKDDILSSYIMYRYYINNHNSVDAQKYRTILLENGVSNLLL